MRILVFNCGSSSLKYRLIDEPGERELAAGEAQRVGPKTAEPARIIHRAGAAAGTTFVDMPDHAAAFSEVMKLLAGNLALRPDAVGHRVVHGGDAFPAHARVDATTLARLAPISRMAPLHNPPALALVDACLRRYPALLQVLVFDTAFHATIPAAARNYALPQTVRRELGVRKYGFHGISHQYVVAEAARFLGMDVDHLNAVSCHLGSGGASLCAVAGGRSVENTMGFSPLQGLIMSTRSGDFDPGATLRLLTCAGGDGESVERTLNRSSGVLGLSGVSADIRDVLARAGKAGPGNHRLKAARDIYLWRIRKYLGAYLVLVGAPHAVIFTDTIGETSAEVRRGVCAGLEAFGLRLDPARNDAVRNWPVDVATPESRVRALVIATNEEISIARAAYRVLVEGREAVACSS